MPHGDRTLTRVTPIPLSSPPKRAVRETTRVTLRADSVFHSCRNGTACAAFREERKRGRAGEIGPLRERIKRILGENASGWQGYKERRREDHQGRSDTSFVTLALDEDLFRRDVRNDGRRKIFSPNERCGGGKCYLEMSGKPLVVERTFGQ